MRYSNSVPAVIILGFVTACSSTAIKTSEIDQIQANCGNVDQTMSMLEEQKDGALARFTSGVRSVVPVSAAINIAKGDYKENVRIATGKKEERINAKLQELAAYKAECQRAGY